MVILLIVPGEQYVSTGSPEMCKTIISSNTVQ